MDNRGALVNGLAAKHFAVFENKRPQPIVSFAEEDGPASVGIVLDVSGSMKRTLGDTKAALKAFLDTANERDEAFLMTVSTHPELNTAFTSDARGLQDRVRMANAGGSTALVDTIYAAVNGMRRAHNPRKAVLVLSDGMDNHSRYSEQELLRYALEADALIYTIGLWTVPPNKKPIELDEQRRGQRFLSELAYKSGGLYFQATSGEEVARATLTIARVLRNEYVIGFAPSPPADGQWRAVQVRSRVPNTRVYWRQGYYSQ